MSSRKNLPLSALLTGLLAVPALGIAPPPALPQSPIVRTQTFPAEMPPEVADQMRRITRGQKPDASGMQALQRKLNLQMQQRLTDTRKRSDDGTDAT
jgi:hypothetical protein